MTNVQLFILSSAKPIPSTSQTRQREVRCVAPKLIRPSGQIYDSRWILEPFIVWNLSNSISGASFLFMSQQFCDSIECKEVPHSHIMPLLLSSVFSWISLPYNNTKCLPANHQSSCVIVSLNDRILQQTRKMFMVKICVSVRVQDRGSDRHPLPAVCIVVYLCRHCGTRRSLRNPPSHPQLCFPSPRSAKTVQTMSVCLCVCVQLEGKSFIFTHE